jgi:hypothetical protein
MIFGSNEFRQDLVSGYYQRFLRRPADAAGLAGFVSALAHGDSDEATIARMVGSMEYLSRV